jgi:hypothetical protein
MRKEHKKELQNTSQEADNQSIKLIKKVKALELELETEYTERSLLVREKLELERLVPFLQNQVNLNIIQLIIIKFDLIFFLKGKNGCRSQRTHTKT